MKILTAFYSLVFLLTAPIVALAGQSTYSNDILGKIFKHKSEHAARVLGLNEFPACDDPKVLDKIVKRFNWAEKHTWQRGVDLGDITRPSERLTLAGSDRLVNRRYCRGHARLSNGNHSTVHYLIEQRQGFASLKWNVEFCVIGRDRWRVYDGSCRTLRR